MLNGNSVFRRPFPNTILNSKAAPKTLWRRAALGTAWLPCFIFCFSVVTSPAVMAQSGTFTIGASKGDPSVCPPVEDTFHRKMLSDVDNGLHTPFLTGHSIFYSDRHSTQAVLNMQIGLNERDESRLTMALEQLNKWPDILEAKMLVQAGLIELATIHHDLAALTVARKAYAALFNEQSHADAQYTLSAYGILIMAMRSEAAGMNDDAKRTLLTEANGLAQDALTLAKHTKAPESIELYENLAWHVQTDIAMQDHDAASLSDIAGKFRARLEQKNTMGDQQNKLYNLASSLYRYAIAAGGAEGLQALEESQNKAGQALAMKAVSTVGIWQARTSSANGRCVSNAELNIVRANATIATQFLRGEDVPPDTAKLKEAISILDRAEAAESRQPESRQPKSLDIMRARAYRLLAKDAGQPDARQGWLDLAKKSLDANTKLAQTCFCTGMVTENQHQRALLGLAGKE